MEMTRPWNAINLIGHKYSRLTIVEEAETRGASRYWLCECLCGNFVTASTGNIRSGNIKSCGCLQRERSSLANQTHGMSKSRIYYIWKGMIKRCYKKADPSYKNYGDRGIKVCDRWKDSFENFYSDMGERPEGKTLDRIDNNGGYEPENCKWSTHKEQSANSRLRSFTNRTSFRGVSYCRGKYQAKIFKGGNYYYLGRFDSPVEAAKEYNKKALELFGDMAVLNNISGGEDGF